MRYPPLGVRGVAFANRDLYHAAGFRFLASGSDSVLLNNAARTLVKSIHEKR